MLNSRLRAVALAVFSALPILGQFGERRRDAPERFLEADLAGSHTPKGRLHKKRPPGTKPRVATIYRATLLETPRNRRRQFNALAARRSKHGRCTEWIRENRRRLACGLPQKRYFAMFDLLHDPLAEQQLCVE